MKRDPQVLPVWTIGHSTRPIAEFAQLLGTAGVTMVIDVRSIRRSRTNPQYNEESLPRSLAQFGIGYTPIAELGGRRSRQKSVPPEVNGYWHNRSFHNYADFAMSAEFDARAAPATEAERAQPMRLDVRGSRLVEMSSADHRRLSAAARTRSASPDGQGTRRAGLDDSWRTGRGESARLSSVGHMRAMTEGS